MHSPPAKIPKFVDLTNLAADPHSLNTRGSIDAITMLSRFDCVMHWLFERRGIRVETSAVRAKVLRAHLAKRRQS
jgi:hypothetical protein